MRRTGHNSGQNAARKLGSQALVVGAITSLVLLAPYDRAPLAAQSQAPTTKTGEALNLLTANPFDRITLIDNSVHDIEPLNPRPLPEYDAEKEKAIQREKDRLAQQKQGGAPPGGNVSIGKETAKIKSQLKEDDRSELIIHLLEGEIRDFKIKRTSIKKVEYFEDMLIAEGERLMLAKQYSKAFEHFLAVVRRNPKWPGLGERVDRFLFEEGSWALLDQDRQRGARLLSELAARNPNYDGLNEKLAVAYGARIDEAINQQRFEFGRRALHDLESISPNHLVVIQSREKFIKRARDLAERAKEKSGPERVDALIDALRVWPALEGTGDEFQAAFAEWPTLDVGVIDIPRGLNPFSKTPAMARAGRLIYRPLVGNSGDSAGVVPTPDQLAESIETADLGRRLEIVLRPGPMWSDGTRPLSSVDVAHALVSWADPRSPGYNARWSDVLERVESSDDTRVAVILRRPLVQAAAWFARPIGPAHAAWDGRVPTRDGKRKPIGTGLFVWISEEKDRMILERNEPASGDSSIPIRRIREVRLPSGPAAVGALVRGEITLLEHVPPDRVASLRERDDIKVGKLQSPSLHVVSLDGRNPALKNRLLRRAIATAIDRKTFLEETLLRRPIDDANRPADGPAIIGASIDAPGVRPYDTGALQAKMLVAGAKPQLGGKPIKLTFEYPALPEAQIAAPWIAENLRAAGMEIDLVERPQSELEARLRAGERFDLAYRVIRTTDPIRDLGPTLCPGYDASPASGGLGALETSPRILQLILQLEQSTDPTEAIALATQVDRECHDELPIIPLWQLEDHFAWRTRLEGPKDGAESLYQGIEQWEVKAWFARDPW